MPFSLRIYAGFCHWLDFKPPTALTRNTLIVYRIRIGVNTAFGEGV